MMTSNNCSILAFLVTLFYSIQFISAIDQNFNALLTARLIRTPARQLVHVIWAGAHEIFCIWVYFLINSFVHPIHLNYNPFCFTISSRGQANCFGRSSHIIGRNRKSTKAKPIVVCNWNHSFKTTGNRLPSKIDSKRKTILKTNRRTDGDGSPWEKANQWKRRTRTSSSGEGE